MSELSGPEHLRASDADRDRVSEHLRGSLAEGRIDMEEYQQRLDAALRAKTVGELRPITADLPVPAPDPEMVAREQRKADLARKEKDKQEWFEQWRSWLGVAVILNVIYVISNVASDDEGWVFYWPIFPLGFWGAAILAGGIFGGRHGGGRH